MTPLLHWQRPTPALIPRPGPSLFRGTNSGGPALERAVLRIVGILGRASLRGTGGVAEHLHGTVRTTSTTITVLWALTHLQADGPRPRVLGGEGYSGYSVGLGYSGHSVGLGYSGYSVGLGYSGYSVGLGYSGTLNARHGAAGGRTAISSAVRAKSKSSKFSRRCAAVELFGMTAAFGWIGRMEGWINR